jgi:cytochrome c oxidase subunit 2
MKDKLGLLVGCAVLFCASLSLSRSTRAQETPLRVEVTASKFAFTPSELNLKMGQPVVLVLKSTDVAHGLRFRELNLDVKAGKGETSEVKFTPDKAGDFVGHCSVFCGSGHGSMELTLHVEQ